MQPTWQKFKAESPQYSHVGKAMSDAWWRGEHEKFTDQDKATLIQWMAHEVLGSHMRETEAVTKTAYAIVKALPQEAVDGLATAAKLKRFDPAVQLVIAERATSWGGE